MAPLDAADGKTLTIGNAVRGFDRQDKVLYEFENYDLMFFHYARAKHLIKDAARPVAAILDDSLLMSGER